ncbi:MAG: bifunctional hydroxymethylpyrimidine kinase/phosphomethylpyrimidine kinase [Limisphaerales bacterium]|jgi:hydroxymethylpyrimidine/phosphomethylpyrimidine kinase|nr:bifunctional hydroxymethylpyrimidine kinase/phosphomethylpyrimidine kinase [Verrucomicrobiota bacterium]
MDKKRVSLPIALTVAGTDSGGGAGVQADLKTFAALGVHGCAAITCLTAQSPKGVRAILSSPAEFLRQQLLAVFSDLPPVAVKTGMLYNAELIHVLVNFLKEHTVKLVVDPVMISTSGSELLQSDAVQTMCEELFPLADLVTPNLDESARLLGRTIENQKELQLAARELYEKFGRPVLAKGGHLRDTEEAVDVLWDGEQEYTFSKPFITDVSTHGTGCTFSSAITAALALGYSLPEAVEAGKNYVSRSIESSVKIAEHYALNWFNDQ